MYQDMSEVFWTPPTDGLFLPIGIPLWRIRATPPILGGELAKHDYQRPHVSLGGQVDGRGIMGGRKKGEENE